MNSRRLQRIGSGQDPRAATRYATKDFAVEFPIGAAVIDVSKSGMGIESNQQLRVGASYVFRVQLGAKSFGLPGRVEWCRFAGTSGTRGADHAAIYKAGVSFSTGPAQDNWRAALERLVARGIEPVAATQA